MDNIQTQGLVLSGGGIKGFGLVGALQYLIDNHIIDDSITYYSGTSIGAIICYLLIIGYTPIEIVVYSITHNVFELKDIQSIESLIKGEGLYPYSIFSDHFEKMTLEKMDHIPTLLELYETKGKTLYTCCYNITKQKKEYISYHTHPTMLAIDAIKLSSSLPFVFNDCVYQDENYIDGGIVDNFPISAISDKNISIIALNIQTMGNKDNYQKIIDKIYTIIMIPIHELVTLQIENETKKERTDTNKLAIIHLELENIKMYDFTISHFKKLEFFSIGYNAIKNHFKKI